MLPARVALLVSLAPIAECLIESTEQRTVCVGRSSRDCQQRPSCQWHMGACRTIPGDPSSHRCNDGERSAACLDVAECAGNTSGPTPEKRWALVYTHSLEHPLDKLPEYSLDALRRYAERVGNTDILLLVPAKGALLRPGLKNKYKMSEQAMSWLREKGVQVREVPWAMPPGVKFRPAPDLGWSCQVKDFMRLHVFGLEEYAAVAYFDTDTQLTGNGDLSQAMKCASNGYFLSASGKLSTFNLGFFALRPHKNLLKAAVHFASVASFDRITGWDDIGFAPLRGYYVGADCGQGFLHTLMYKPNASAVNASMTFAGVGEGSGRLNAAQLDRCIWNRQHDTGCPEEWGCDQVVMIHKDTEKSRCHKVKVKKLVVSWDQRVS